MIRFALAKRPRRQLIAAPRHLHAVPLERVLVIAPQPCLRGAADANYGKGGDARLREVVRPMPVPVQPEANAALCRHAHEVGEVAESMRSPLTPSASDADRIMGDEDARPAVEPGEQLPQPFQLGRVHLPARVPRPAIAGTRVHGY